MKTNFVIFFSGQEGSTSIVEHLNNFDSIGILSGKKDDLGVYEPFGQHMFLEERYGGSGSEISENSLVSCIDSLFKRNEKEFANEYKKYNDLSFLKKSKKYIFSCQNIGFKIFIPCEKLSNRLICTLKDNNCSIFILERKDILKWAISKSQGHLKQFDFSAGRISKTNISVDLQKLEISLDMCNKIQIQKDKLYDSCLELNTNCFKLYYEDFLHNKYEFFKNFLLKINSKDDISKCLSIPTQIKKVHFDELIKIENYVEIKAKFKDEVKKSEKISLFYEYKNKKIRITNQAIWPHLRSGWGVVNKKVLALHNPKSKIIFEDYLDGVFGSGREIKSPWVGFFHNTPRNHHSTNALYGFKNDTSLESMLGSSCFRDSLKNCLGIFTLSYYLKKFIIEKYPDLIINSLFLPTEEPKTKFDFNKFEENSSIITIGHWQRLFYNINAIKGIDKKFLKWSSNVNVEWWFEKHGIKKSHDLIVVERLDNKKYDELLENTVVFLELFDAAANNIIVECIARNTPVIVNKLPGLCDYLGLQYPLFYENFDQAQSLVLNKEKILEGHEYLKNMNKEKYNPEYFIKSLKESPVYRSLPGTSAKIF